MPETAGRKDKPSSPNAEVELDRDEPGMRFVAALRWGLPVASLAAAGAVGAVYGLGTAILVLAGGVLLGVVAILWASVRTLAGDTPITLEEAMVLGAPSAAEEQKRAVLQALKDLEYERTMGKIADADYEDLLRRYRAEAKRLLRAVDEDLAPLRARAAAYLNEQLGPQKSRSAAPPTRDRACPSCKADNDADALFCKKCGAKLVAKERHDATA
jgi:hypothetical protein